MQKDSSMESGTDQYDIASLEILNKCHLDLFPKKSTIYDDINLTDNFKDIESKLVLLCGEYIQYLGKSGKFNEDIIMLTNYRLFLLLNNETSFINFPIMLIEYVEMKEIFYVYVHLKNVKTVKIIFSTNEKSILWHQRLMSISSKISKLDDLFAFRFYSWFINEKTDDSRFKLDFDRFDPRGLVKQEFERMEFDENKWRITRVNINHKLCQTYPELLIVPDKINDDQLQKIANFRSSRRFPTVVWKSKINNCVIARSSQPNVGLLAWRLSEDEQLIKSIANNCYNLNSTSITNTLTSTNTTNNNNNNNNNSNNNNLTVNNEDIQSQTQQQDGILLIIDARCRSVALANRVKGGGYEYSEYYTNCEIQFMNLENIHVIRNSFQSLRILCQNVTDNKQFYSQLEHTKWLHHLSGIIKAARTVVCAIDRQSKPVLIHCSDGWDRTPQVLALAKILLDPYYRTIKGFQILIELEWLMFGHQFAKRNGHAVNHTDVNERCPVFLQWLDCVFQLLKQFPNAFEFNETFLLKLCYHSYSCLFGTFLCDSYEERCNEHIYDRTFSVWSYLNNQNNKIFINYLYDDTFQDILYPKFELVNLTLWTKLFCDSEISYLINKILDQQDPSSITTTAATTTTTITPAQPQLQQQPTVSAPIKTTTATTTSSSNKLQDDQFEQNLSFSFSPPTQILASNDHTMLSTSSSSSSTAINETNSITNSIQKLNNTNYNTNNNNNNNNKVPTLHTTTTAPMQIINRTRSFSDFSKFSYDSNEQIHLIHNSNNINSNNNSYCNDEPIIHRSSSESNLLADALENFGTTPITNSFILYNTRTNNITNKTIENNINNANNLDKSLFLSNIIENNININNTNTNSNSNGNGNGNNNNNSVILNNINGDNDSLINNDLINTNTNSKNKNQIDDLDGNNIVNNENSTELSTSNSTQVINSSLPIQINNKILKLQKSTDTLVDDDDDNNDINNYNLNINNNGFINDNDNENINKITQINDITTNTTNYNTNKCNEITDEQLKTVSTSTSGLSDYVYSTQIQAINDTIKKFELTFSNNNKNINENNSNNNNNNNNNNILMNINSSNSNINNNYKNNLNSKIYLNGNYNKKNNYYVNGNSHSSSNSTTTTISNNNSSNSSNNSDTSNSNSSNSSNKSNSSSANNSSNNLNSNKKTIHQLLDIDGLTTIDDNCNKRLIEREEEYKKEIAFLKAQVQKCKLFLNTLSNNQLWLQANCDINSEFDRRYDENGRSHSLGNDSTCSSWDEVEEPEYRLTTWIPDHLVTHCQNCNQKFSYAVRKHHCRHCGQVFCYKCSNQYFPLPNQNLTTPVRVCIQCKPAVEQLNLITSSHKTGQNGISTSTYHRTSSSPIMSTLSTTNTQTISYSSNHQQQSSKCNGTCNNINSNRCCMKQKTQNPLVKDHQSQKVSV